MIELRNTVDKSTEYDTSHKSERWGVLSTQKPGGIMMDRVAVSIRCDINARQWWVEDGMCTDGPFNTQEEAVARAAQWLRDDLIRMGTNEQPKYLDVTRTYTDTTVKLTATLKHRGTWLLCTEVPIDVWERQFDAISAQGYDFTEAKQRTAISFLQRAKPTTEQVEAATPPPLHSVFTDLRVEFYHREGMVGVQGKSRDGGSTVVYNAQITRDEWNAFIAAHQTEHATLTPKFPREAAIRALREHGLPSSIVYKDPS